MDGFKVKPLEAGERCDGICTNDALRVPEPPSPLRVEREGDVWRLPPPPLLKPEVAGDWTHLKTQNTVRQAKSDARETLDVGKRE